MGFSKDTFRVCVCIESFNGFLVRIRSERAYVYSHLMGFSKVTFIVCVCI